MYIAFNSETDSDTRIRVLDALRGCTIHGIYSNSGYPAAGVVSTANDEGLVIFEADETGAPLKYSVFHVPWQVIHGIVII